MASWFDSAAQSIGNFVTGHGLEDNSQRAIMDAQEKKKKEEQQAAANRQIVQQKTTPQPQTPNNLLNVPSINTPSLNVPSIQNPIQTNINQNNIQKQQPSTPSTNLNGLPTTPNSTIKTQVQTTPTVQVQTKKPTGIDYSNPLTFAGEFGKEWLKNAGNLVKDTVINPFVNTAKTGGDLIAGGIGRLTGNKAMTKRADTAFGENWNGSIPGFMTNWIGTLGATKAYNEQYDKITKDPTTDQRTKDWLLANLTDSLNQETAKSGQNTAAPLWQNALGTVAGVAGLIPGMTSTVRGLESIVNTPKLINDLLTNQLTRGAVNSGDALLNDITKRPVMEPTITATPDVIPQNLLESANSPLLITEKSSVPQNPNNVLSSGGISGFVTKTPQQIADTEAAIQGIKKIDSTLNIIRQGKTNNISAPEVRSIMQQRNDLLSVANGEKTLQEAADATTPAPQVTKTGINTLQQEALKYKNADEFASSLNKMKWGEVTGVGELPIDKISKSQMKVLLKEGLPKTNVSPAMSMGNFEKGRQITQPIEVSQRGSTYVIENGRHRLFQALTNGDETIPVVFKNGEGKAYSKPLSSFYDNPSTPIVTKTQEAIFTDKASMVNDVTNAAIERADSGDFDGARSAATRLYDDPEYGAKTQRGQALLERGKKLDAYIKKTESSAPQVTKGAVADTTDLSNPGATPTDGVITSNPTNADLANIIENTPNTSTPRPPKAKLTPQNEMGDITQKQMDNFTGELGVNKNGQIYQKVDQATAKDIAMKNLLDGKTPEEYLATAAKTGEADSAELAILMQQVPKDSPVWAELASLKGKLGTQKGQALALLEKTMRQSATSEQLASRTLQKANTAGFDTTQIAGDISRINKEFTDARDAYNAVLNTTGSTNAEVQAAKDAFYKATKKSFTDEGNILSKLAKTKEQKNLAYKLQKKSDVYLQGMATSSLTSSPTSALRNFTQGVGALVNQAGLAPKVEAAINRKFGGAKTGSFNTAGAKVGAKTGFENLKSEVSTRASQLGLTKNPVSWVKHPINTIRQITTTGTELGNIPMEAGIRGGMSSEYEQILKSQGYKGAELKHLTERNTITDPLNIRTKYAKEINDLNGLSSEVDRTGGTFRDNIKNQFIKAGATDKTAYEIADFIDRDIFGFFKPTLIVGKKTADYATGGLAHLAPAIVKLSRGDKAGFVNEISKTIATAGVTLPVWSATGYALAKAGVLNQNEYGEWEINGVPISGYVGAFGGPMAMGAIAGQNQRDGNPTFDGFADKAWKTIANTYPYGQAGDKLKDVANVATGVFGELTNGQNKYEFKEGIASLLGGLGKEAIPASSFLNMLNKMLGGNVKSTVVENPKDATGIDAGMAGLQQAGNQIMSGLPIVSNALPDKKNSFGDTIKKPDAIPAFFGASNDSIKQSDAATGITSTGSKDLNDVAKTNLTTVDDKTAYNAVIKRLEDAGDQVTDTNVFKELVKDKNYILAAKYDSKINQSIDDADKISLAKYDALDSERQKVYVEDQQNALDVYTAQLNNKQANGTLTNDDQKTFKVWGGDSDSNSLLVKALVAKTNVENKVSEDVLNLYEQVTSKSDYNDLSDDQRAALNNYAAQLEANGVKVREFLSGGGSGSGSKSGGASSVPLTKAVTSGGGGSGKFAHQDINVDIPQVIKPAPQYVIKQRKISVD